VYYRISVRFTFPELILIGNRPEGLTSRKRRRSDYAEFFSPFNSLDAN
jgi:hypothetical protein